MTVLRREAMIMVGVAALCALVLASVIALTIGGAVMTGQWQGHWSARLVPTLLYFLAIFAACWAGWQIAKGREFTRIIPRLLSLIGALLAAAGVFETFGTPIVMRYLGLTKWQGFGIFDPSYTAIGTVGLLLWLLGRLMRRAVDMSQELEEIP